MSRKTFLSIMCVGTAALMLMPLFVPMSFSGGVAGRSSLLPSWLVAVLWYAMGSVVLVLSGTALRAELQRPPRRAWSRVVEFPVRPGAVVDLADVPGVGRSRVRVVLDEVRSDRRVRIAADIVLGTSSPRPLGEIVHDDGAPEHVVEATIRHGESRTVRWRTTLVEIDGADSAEIMAAVHVTS